MRLGPIVYRFTIEDAALYSAAVSGEISLKREDSRLYDYTCHEDNYGLANILKGAWMAERRAVKH